MIVWDFEKQSNPRKIAYYVMQLVAHCVYRINCTWVCGQETRVVVEPSFNSIKICTYPASHSSLLWFVNATITA